MRTFTIELPETITVTRDGTDYEISTEAWTGPFIAYLATRGLQENVTNATAGKKGAAAREAIEAKVRQMVAGEIPSGGGGKRLDPIEAMARTIAVPAMVKGGLAKSATSALAMVTKAGTVRAALTATETDEAVIDAIYAKAKAAVDAASEITIPVKAE